jgi:hypothetical protein
MTIIIITQHWHSVVEIPALFKHVYISFTIIMSEEQGVASSEEEVEEEVEEEEAESISRERFLERVSNASNGNELLDVLALLPNTAQRWGH